MEIEDCSRKHALKNASEHEGKANAGSVIGSVIQETGAEPSEVQEVVPQIVAEVNSMSLEEQREALQQFEFEEDSKEHDPLPDLKDGEDQDVVVRFAPNPNGPAHLGSARGMVINGELKEKYNGELVLRFDDTDPRKKRPRKEAYKMYEEDYEWLGYEVDTVLKSSKQFKKYYRHAEELIEQENAYVCECPPEKARELRRDGEPCEHRSQEPGENMEKWKEMKNGGYGEGDAVLKIKTEVDHKNPAIRDFVAFRIIEDADHPITGDRYRVWPLLDFAGAIEDHYTDTTHIVRGKDLRASTKRQDFIYNYLDWEYPEVRYWGRIEISGFEAPMSTSSLGEMIDADELDGWDDPRAPTLAALRKRGFKPEAIREFFVEMGVTENDVDASIETLESENRNFLEDSDRCFFVRNPAEIEIEGVPEDLEPEVALHPDHPDRGSRSFDLEREDGKIKVLMEDEDVKDGFLRLKGFCNIEIRGETAEYVEGDHEIAMEKNADIVHWLPTDAEKAKVRMPDGSVIDGRVEREVDFGETVQFERFGFARKDEDGSFYFAHS